VSLFALLFGSCYRTSVSAVLIDTHRLVTNLKKRGFTEDQAAGITDAIQELDLTQLSTKQDLRELELRMTIKLGSLIVAGIGALAALYTFTTV
jgi:hypothetical protein